MTVDRHRGYAVAARHFVSSRTVARNPSGTVRQSVGGKAHGYRSASRGIRAGLLATVLLFGSAAACTGRAGSEPDTHKCSGNDEVFSGPEGPCPRTGTVLGKVSGFGGPSPGTQMTLGIGAVRLLRAGKLVAETRTDRHRRFRFTVSIGTYDVKADAFSST